MIGDPDNSIVPTFYVKGKADEVMEKLKTYLKVVFPGDYWFPDFPQRDSDISKHPDVISVQNIHLINKTSHKAEQIAASVLWGSNSIVQLVEYRSRPGEIQLIPDFQVEKGTYTVDEDVLTQSGLEVNKRVFLG